MRTSLAITLIIITILSFPSWGLTVDDLIYRKGIAYEKFTDVPFTGEVEGQFQGAFKNGWREGEWKVYFENGQLRYKGGFKKGKMHGSFITYNEDQSIEKDYTGMFENGVKVSD